MEKQRSEDVFGLYMNALTEAVEPHTAYFSPRTAESFKITDEQLGEGIGATLRTGGEYTKIVETVKGGPADKSKEVFKDDRIVAVGQDEKGEMEDIIESAYGRCGGRDTRSEGFRGAFGNSSGGRSRGKPHQNRTHRARQGEVGGTIRQERGVIELKDAGKTYKAGHH